MNMIDTEHLPKTRKEALTINHTQYYTGVKCVHGHDSVRRAKTGECIECRKIYRKKWIKTNSQKIKFYNDKYSDYAKLYYLTNKERITKRVKNRRLSNKSVVNAATRLYQASKMHRTPKWITEEERWVMREIYDLARLRSKQTGVNWHVDHIIPLQGKLVSGLHVPTNLQVIPASVNIRKANRYVL